MVKVRDTQLSPLVARSGRARMASYITHHLDAYLAACQVGITLSSLALGWLGEPAIAALLEPPLHFVVGTFAPAASHAIAIAIAFALISALHIVLGELAPKSVAIQRALPTALWTAYPLHVFYRVMYPFIRGLNAVGNAVVGLMGLRPATESERAHSPEELALLVDQAGEAGVIEPAERDVARRALSFGDRSIRSVMIPRTEVVSVPDTATLSEILAVSAERPFTRLPVHRGDGHEIVGVVHVRDLVHATLRAGTAAGLMRPVAIFPETADLIDALEVFRRDKVHLGVVIDEYGDSAGIVSLGAIVEQLLGITEEFEPVAPGFQQQSDGSLIADGMTQLDEMRDRLAAPLDDPSAETIGGFVFNRLGRVAQVGDVVEADAITFEVLALDGRRIDRVRVTRGQRLAKV
jgi:CBS domain containing-hemolysin-like protein